MLALTLGLAAAVCLLPASQAQAGDVIKLNFSTMFPRMHLQAQLNQLFCDMIAERTKGKVKITLFPGGTLTSPPKNYDGVVKGVSDIGMSCPLYVGGRFPVSQIFEMPSAITNGWVTSMGLHGPVQQVQAQGIRRRARALPARPGPQHPCPPAASPYAAWPT